MWWCGSKSQEVTHCLCCGFSDSCTNSPVTSFCYRFCWHCVRWWLVLLYVLTYFVVRHYLLGHWPDTCDELLLLELSVYGRPDQKFVTNRYNEYYLWTDVVDFWGNLGIVFIRLPRVYTSKAEGDNFNPLATLVYTGICKTAQQIPEKLGLYSSLCMMYVN